MNIFFKQISIIVSIIILSLLINTFINGKNGVLHLIQLKKIETDFQNKIINISKQNEQLADNIIDLKTNNNVIEQIARRDLGMMKHNEIEYNFVLSNKKSKMIFAKQFK